MLLLVVAKLVREILCAYTYRDLLRSLCIVSAWFDLEFNMSTSDFFREEVGAFLQPKMAKA